eukprot:c658_g1_i1 orf=462-623(+)
MEYEAKYILMARGLKIPGLLETVISFLGLIHSCMYESVHTHYQEIPHMDFYLE